MVNIDIRSEMVKYQRENATEGQFGGVPNVPLHTHNGVDSPRLKPRSIGILIGGVTLVGGTYRIIDKRIQPYPKSIITVTTCDEHNPALQLWAECFLGYADINSHAPTDRINYSIILNP